VAPATAFDLASHRMVAFVSFGFAVTGRFESGWRPALFS
jgi:hypothetical protein